jgi:uncharacterized membrane protein YhdT
VIVVAVIWLALAYFLGKSAQGVGRSFWVWFILALIIDPILAWIVYAIVARGR